MVGPIGAGKSSILDAVAFALYGKTPTFERDTKSLINQTSSECHVELRFEVDGQVWRAARGLRRKGASGHQLQRLSGDEPDAEVVEPITGERAVREHVERLLGMDFDAFCRSVLLAQNRFADFLKATPSDRNEVLKGVFGYERFDAALEAAKRRVTAAALLLESLEREGSQLEAAREQLAGAERRLELATERARALQAAREPYEQATIDARDADRRAEDAEERTRRLHEAAEALPSSDEVGVIVDAVSESDAALERAELLLEQTEAARVEAESTHAAVTERVGDQVAFAALVAEHAHLVTAAEGAAHARALASAACDESSAAVDEMTRSRTASTAAIEDSARTLRHAVEAVDEAERTLHEARHADMARSLRAELVSGDECPVCRQSVGSIPAAGRAPKIQCAERALERGRRAEATARSEHEAATAATVAAEERLASAARRHDERVDALAAADAAMRSADAALAAAQSELVDRLGEGDPRSMLEERGRELAASAEALERAAAHVDDARSALEHARRLGEQGRHSMASTANRLASVWGMLGGAREVAADPESVRGAFVELGEAVLAGHEQARTTLGSAQRDAQRAAEVMSRLLAGVGLRPDDDFTLALATASAERGAADEQVRSLRRAIDASSDIDERITGARADHSLASRLVSDLQPSRFLAFLWKRNAEPSPSSEASTSKSSARNAYRFTDDDSVRGARHERRRRGAARGQPLGRRDVPRLARPRSRARRDGRAGRRTARRVLPRRGVRVARPGAPRPRDGRHRATGGERRPSPRGAREPRRADAGDRSRI